MTINRKKQTISETFLDHIERQAESGCWEWKKARNGNGYGILKVNGKIWIASRFSWFRTFGGIPQGMDVLHHCDNKICVNPSHLYLGTDKENALDRERRGRGRDPRTGRHIKMSFELAGQVRAAYVPGLTRYVDLAELFGIKHSQVGNIVTGKCW